MGSHGRHGNKQVWDADHADHLRKFVPNVLGVFNLRYIYIEHHRTMSTTGIHAQRISSTNHRSTWGYHSVSPPVSTKDFLIKNGCERIIDEVRREQFKVR